MFDFQDRYVPLHSARVAGCDAIQADSNKQRSAAYTEMLEASTKVRTLSSSFVTLFTLTLFSLFLLFLSSSTYIFASPASDVIVVIAAVDAVIAHFESLLVRALVEVPGTLRSLHNYELIPMFMLFEVALVFDSCSLRLVKAFLEDQPHLSCSASRHVPFPLKTHFFISLPLLTSYLGSQGFGGGPARRSCCASGNVPFPLKTSFSFLFLPHLTSCLVSGLWWRARHAAAAAR